MRFRRSPPGARDVEYEKLVQMWGGLPSPAPDPAALETQLRRAILDLGPHPVDRDARVAKIGGAEIAVALWSTTTSFVESVDAALRGIRLTMERFLVLREIGTAHEPLDMKSLARRLSVTPPTISDLVRRLVRDGYVEQRADQFDGRVKMPKATEKGLYAAVAATRLITKTATDLTAAMSSTERHALLYLLDRVAMPSKAST